MINPWSEWLRAAQFAYQAQCVIAMRMLRLAEGGPAGALEAQRMVAEKVAAMAAAQTAAAMALALGSSPAAAAARAMTPVRRRVRANHRRLSRPRKRR